MAGFLKEDRRDDAHTHTQNENQINGLLEYELWVILDCGCSLLPLTLAYMSGTPPGWKGDVERIIGKPVTPLLSSKESSLRFSIVFELKFYYTVQSII